MKEILNYKNKILKELSEEVTEINGEIIDVVDDMFETLANTTGVGLAAPQIGVLKRIIIVDLSKKAKFKTEMINPVITYASAKTVIMEEGCLSAPGIYEEIERPETIQVTFQKKNGNINKIKAIGFVARVIQHEIDHLDGIVCVTDKAL